MGLLGAFVGLALFAAVGGLLLFGRAALDQLAHRGHAQLARQQRVAGAMRCTGRRVHQTLLLGQGFVQPLHEALVAVHDFDGATLAELAGPALLVFDPVGGQLCMLRLLAAGRVIGIRRRSATSP